MYFIDTHTHLYSDQFDQDRTQMIEKAITEGVEKFLLPNIDKASVKGMKELIKEFPTNCFAMMGLHPCSVNENVEEELRVVEEELSANPYIAVGEIGMDLYWDKTFVKEQEMAFRKQILWAKQRKLPIVIHCRDAFDEILTVLDELNDDELFGVFHCFTGNLEQAKHILKYGNFKLGIGGVLTFKNSGLDKVVEQLNINDLVLETDSPYLAPAPFRGKRNESSYLIRVAERLSEIYKLPMTDIAKQTTMNANQIFKL
ncbi:MAG: TatD family hydrolase [Flavobacteriales bacterium]|nr:TatD family hydrolase [Flavobacteriales bacterium]